MLGAIGDFMVTTPTIAGLKQHYPHAVLTVVVRKQIAELAAHNSHIDLIIVYDQTNLLTRLRFLWNLVKTRFDLWVDLHAPTPNTVCSNRRVYIRNGFLSLLPRVVCRRGFNAPWLRLVLTQPVAVPPEHVLFSENIVHTTLRLTGHNVKLPVRKELVLTSKERTWADDYLKRNNCGETRISGLFFGSKQASDTWPVENAIALGTKLKQEYANQRFLIFGGTLERLAATMLEDAFRAGSVPVFLNTAGTLTLTQTAALLERCDVLITTDAGPMHIADALQVPLVVLFSNKNYRAIWEPLTDNKSVLQHKTSCGPCFSAHCDHGNLCMRSITPEEVMAEVKKLKPA
jgi:heptosyltransferase-2